MDKYANTYNKGIVYGCLLRNALLSGLEAVCLKPGEILDIGEDTKLVPVPIDKTAKRLKFRRKKKMAVGKHSRNTKI